MTPNWPFHAWPPLPQPKQLRPKKQPRRTPDLPEAPL